MCSTSHRGTLANPALELVPHRKLTALLALVLAANPISTAAATAPATSKEGFENIRRIAGAIVLQALLAILVRIAQHLVSARDFLRPGGVSQPASGTPFRFPRRWHSFHI